MTKMQASRSITILGATGSIGDSTSDVILANRERFDVETLAGYSNVEKLAERAKKLGAKRAVIAKEAGYAALKDHLAGTSIEAACGRQAVIASAAEPTDLVVCAMVGAPGIEPAMAAIEAGNTIALANKEALVCAGPVMMKRAAEKGVRILPLDSEHNALFQVFEEDNRAQIEAITVTASGGPFRTWTMEQIRSATLADALNHPNWSMGQKVTIDSASLANKGLEVIEAHHLFALGPDAIKVVVHPQSIIHGMVHYNDGSVLAQLGTPDMRTPIAAALAWPQRYQAPQVKRLDLAELASLTFEPPDLQRFPMLGLAFDAMREGGAAPAFFNAANEVAVKAFVEERCAFHEIATIVAMTLEKASAGPAGASFASLDDVLAADRHGQHIANVIVDDQLHRQVASS
jgi:1-deoxy-D-xylulose-5-phosphate reductoisomerase